jgi:hypothetical protein
MIFQVFLVVALLALSAYAYSQRRRVPLVAYGVLVLSAGGIALAVAPEFANQLAEFIGVGRGADLILYVFVLIVLAAIFNLHLRLRAQQETLTELVRALGIRNAERPKVRGGAE